MGREMSPTVVNDPNMTSPILSDSPTPMLEGVISINSTPFDDRGKQKSSLAKRKSPGIAHKFGSVVPQQPQGSKKKIEAVHVY